MSYPFEDKTALKHRKETKEQSAEDLIFQHDIKIQELSIRLDQIENILAKIQKKYPAYWDEIKI